MDARDPARGAEGLLEVVVHLEVVATILEEQIGERLRRTTTAPRERDSCPDA